MKPDIVIRPELLTEVDGRPMLKIGALEEALVAGNSDPFFSDPMDSDVILYNASKRS